MSSAPTRVGPATGPLRGEVRVPGDKSISHRALIFAGLGEGQGRIRGLSPSQDVQASLEAMRALGLRVEAEGDQLRVWGGAGQLVEPQGPLRCENSGTSMRLLCGLLAGQPFHTVLDGDASLRRRPMARVVEPLRQMGAQVDGRDGGRLAPLALRGRRPLDGLRHRSAVASGQVKSALLLAAAQAREPSFLDEPEPSRDHGERLLRAMGVQLDLGLSPQGEPRLELRPGPPLALVDVDVPRDPSGAAFFVVAACLVPGSRLRLPQVGLNPGRRGFLDLLQRMGAQVEIHGQHEASGEARGDLEVKAAELRGIRIAPGEVVAAIDELPILAIAAAFAEGETELRGAAELRVKESDRIQATVAMLRALGAPAEELPDGFVVQGSAGAPLAGGLVDAQGDHRIAMSAAIGGLRCRQGVGVRGADSAAVSFPGFFALLEALRGH